MHLGQQTAAVSLGSRAAKIISRSGSKKALPVGNALEMLKAPEMLVDLGLILAAAPTVSQPEAQINTGE
jgi:hypothetical protein